MALFFVGVIEMVIATYWTKSVARAKVVRTGAITMVNIFIWFYVIRIVVDNLDNWTAIIPYAAGCAIGSMLGSAFESRDVRRLFRRKRSSKRRSAGQVGLRPVSLPITADDTAYETIR
ncbi:MAG: DUF5698 domain-containing protein [bacterium]